MLKSNVEIITLAASQKGFNYTGDNLFTFDEWSAMGYKINKGAKAFITTRLWSSGINKRLKPKSLFRTDQVTKNEVKKGITATARRLIQC